MTNPRTDVTKTAPRRSGRAAATAVALVAVSAVLALTMLSTAQATTQLSPLPTPGFAGPGEYCIDDANPPGGTKWTTCTANDTRISKLTPDMTDVCLSVGDTTTVRFSADLVIGASTRYDLAMYIATDGGEAELGSMCYKDVLQPVAELNADGDPMNPLGAGPFKNEDGDLCGEANQTVGAFYKLQQELTITCTDEDNDGMVDPISTCLSWANNADQFNCTGVSATVPGPGTGSKCYCERMTPEPPMLIYRGFDWGDLPDTYGTLTASDGARHAIQDRNNDGIPGTQGAVAAVWLGQTADYSPNAESDGIPTGDATGDDTANTNDEDGVTVPAGNWAVGAGGKFTVEVNSSSGECTNCTLGFWIDWNQDGDFTDPGESYTQPVVYGTQTVAFTITASQVPGDFPSQLNVRFRLYSGSYTGDIEPTGLVVNGEVEDYQFRFGPNALSLSGFAAAPVATTLPALGGLIAAMALAAVGVARRRKN